MYVYTFVYDSNKINKYLSRLQGHFKYFHNIVAKLCTIDHQSCQEPETLSVGYFFQNKL